MPRRWLSPSSGESCRVTTTEGVERRLRRAIPCRTLMGYYAVPDQTADDPCPPEDFRSPAMSVDLTGPIMSARITAVWRIRLVA